MIKTAADLAYGTDRSGVWLSQHGVRFVDGVDVTPENPNDLEAILRRISHAARTAVEESGSKVLHLDTLDSWNG